MLANSKNLSLSFSVCPCECWHWWDYSTKDQDLCSNIKRQAATENYQMKLKTSCHIHIIGWAKSVASVLHSAKYCGWKEFFESLNQTNISAFWTESLLKKLHRTVNVQTFCSDLASDDEHSCPRREKTGSVQNQKIVSLFRSGGNHMWYSHRIRNGFHASSCTATNAHVNMLETHCISAACIGFRVHYETSRFATDLSTNLEFNTQK